MVARVGRVTPFVMGFCKRDFSCKEIDGNFSNYKI